MKIALALPLLFAVSQAYAVQAGAGITFGPSEYKQTDIRAALSLPAVSLEPTLSIYTFKGAPTYKTLSARVGWDSALWGIGVSGGITPEESGYENVFAGADIAVSLSATGGGGRRRIGGAGGGGGAPTGKGIGRVDVGGGVKATKHESAGVERTQTEIHGFVGASIVGVNASARLSKSSYDKTIPAGFATVYSPVSGHLANANGLADTSVALRAELPFFPMVTPWGSFTRTTYKDATGDTTALAVGAEVGLEMVALSAAVQRIAYSGTSDDNLLSLGATLRFGGAN